MGGGTYHYYLMTKNIYLVFRPRKFCTGIVLLLTLTNVEKGLKWYSFLEFDIAVFYKLKKSPKNRYSRGFLKGLFLFVKMMQGVVLIRVNMVFISFIQFILSFILYCRKRAIGIFICLFLELIWVWLCPTVLCPRWSSSRCPAPPPTRSSGP